MVQHLAACLDVTTGKRVWHFQTVHHDKFDYEILLRRSWPTYRRRPEDEERCPGQQQVVRVRLRPRDGKPARPIEERPDPSARPPGERASRTQPFPTKPPAFIGRASPRMIRSTSRRNCVPRRSRSPGCTSWLRCSRRGRSPSPGRTASRGRFRCPERLVVLTGPEPPSILKPEGLDVPSMTGPIAQNVMPATPNHRTCDTRLE